MNEDRESCAQLIEDYEHIASLNHMFSLRLNGTVSVVTSLIQIIDSKRSLMETTNLSRLTYLALVFVPLTFVSSLFSMNGNLASAAQTFWIYFAVAIPMCVLVFLIARPPKKILGLLQHESGK
jgi:Mg2+ and Co2+ transporter CorA